VKGRGKEEEKEEKEEKEGSMEDFIRIFHYYIV